jgi:hypothetical protein
MSMSDAQQFRLARASFLLSCAIAVFGYGVVVGQYEVFPFSILKFAQDSVTQVFDERETLLGTRPKEYLYRSRYPGSGVATHHPERTAPDLILMYGFFDGGTQARLIRSDGTVVHRWPVKFYDLFPETGHIKPDELVPRTNWNGEIHGAYPLPDGSIIFNFNYMGSARLDRCGRTLWTLPRMTHHAVTRASDGTFLIPSARYIEGQSRFPTLHPPYTEDTILKITEDGKVVSETSVLDIFYGNNYQGLLFMRRGRGDMTHTNDIDELTPELASRFPMFATGDLMLSMRMGSMILVVDPATMRLKWYQAGPWLGQHDPDFLENGKILVYNNNYDGTEDGSLFGNGNIMELDPATRAITYRYGTAPGQAFYAESSGKHQELPGGNVLVTEAKAGRVFEFDRNGQIVWEFINRYDEKDAALITEATRYPESYFKVTDWACR